MKEMILASASPRRKQLLSNLGIDFSVIVSDIDENLDTTIENSLFVCELALLKGADVLRKCIAQKKSGVMVIAADTIVSIDGKIFGKPSDREDAFDMLSSLSGRTHDVYTGVCIADGSTGVLASRFARTRIVFKVLTEEQIYRYINSGEPYDKAGGYGIQGEASSFVDKIEGDYFNVVGLPMALLCDMLSDADYFEET